MSEYMQKGDSLDIRSARNLSLNQGVDFIDNRDIQKQVNGLILQFKAEGAMQFMDPPPKRQSPRLRGRTPVDYNSMLESDDAARLPDSDPAYQLSYRSMLFGGFASGVREEVFRQWSKGSVLCQCQYLGCNKSLTLDTMSVDHREECSTYFNKEGYLKTRAERITWYNNCDNLQPMCVPCNSRKSGPPYDSAKVMIALRRK